MVMINNNSNSSNGSAIINPKLWNHFYQHVNHARSVKYSLTFILMALIGTVVWNQSNNYHVPSNSHIRASVLSYDSIVSLNESNQQQPVRYLQDECRFYLAESAIPNGGLALYTAIDIPKGEETQSMPDICIYVADTPSRTAFHTHSWNKAKFIGQFEGNNPRAACEGVATLVNSMPSKNDVRTSVLVSMHHHTNGGLHRLRDPGAGAISQYYGITSKAARDVNAGSELTIEYGDWTFDDDVEYVAPIRSVDWLRTHGMCIDNIEIKTATDQTMGRGAFARYSLPKGSLVAPAPIQMFKNRQAFAQQIPEALFVNYCFQPAGTDMLLFPYGPGVNLINHGSGKKANVKIVWSNHYMSHSNWLDLPLDQFWVMDYPGAIMFEIIALRDIQAGEEYYMDYGTEWERAWEEHVAHWQPYTNQSSSPSNYTYVEEIDRTKPFRTVEEQELEPYSSNLKSVCMTQNWDRDTFTTMEWIKPKYEFPKNLIYCNLLSRSFNETSQEYMYNVSLNFHALEPDVEDKQKYIDTNVPQWAISFVDKPYASDLHLPNSFRHPIGLPQDIMPPLWQKS